MPSERQGAANARNAYECASPHRLVVLWQTRQAAGTVADKLVTFKFAQSRRLLTLTRYASLDGTQMVAVSDYAYDQLSRPVSLVHYQDAAEPLAGYTWTWKGGGNQIEVDIPSGDLGPQFGTGWMFSFGGPFAPAASREVEINTLPNHVWTFDTALLGRLVQATSTDGTADYQYDPRGQLIGADYTAGAGLPTSAGAGLPTVPLDTSAGAGLVTVPPDEFYTYDPNGNRTNPGYITGDHNRLLSDGTYHYEYDAEGNLTRRTEIVTGEITEYHWDHRNRLVRVTVRATDNGLLTTDTSYVYDTQNRWIARSHDPDGVQASGTALAGGGFDAHFVYEANQIILQLNATGAATNRYLWGPAVDQILADEQISDLTVPGNILWPLTDHLNTVRDLAVHDADTATTTIVNHLIYDAYGRLVAQSNPEHTTLFAFTARPFDPATNLQNNLNRWYDPEVGRWLSEDPIGFEAADVNLYRYVENIVTTATDPSGQQPPGTYWSPSANMPVPYPSGVPLPRTSPEPWRAPYQRNPAAQVDFDELATFVRDLPRDVAWLDPCYVWAGEVDVPRRFWPNYQRPDKSSITVRQVYWDVKGLAVEGGHTAFEVMFPDGTCIYFDEGGTWSSIAGALGGRDRWFRPDEIPSHYENQRYSLESLSPPQAP